MHEPVVAVVVGAGLGLRYGGNTPKPALRMTGKALIAMSIEAMAAGGCTDAVIVINEHVEKSMRTTLAAMPINVQRTYGGDSRQASVLNGLKVIRDDPRLSKAKTVLIHDAVRPMVPANVVADVIAAVEGGAQAVAPAIPVTDSIRMVNGEGSEVVDRSTLRAIQTPQGFPFQTVLAAHEAAAATDEPFTDDLSCVQQLGHQVVLVPGSRMSMKITEPGDMTIAKALWGARESFGHHSGRRFFRHMPRPLRRLGGRLD